MVLGYFGINLYVYLFEKANTYGTHNFGVLTTLMNIYPLKLPKIKLVESYIWNLPEEIHIFKTIHPVQIHINVLSLE